MLTILKLRAVAARKNQRLLLDFGTERLLTKQTSGLTV